MSTRVNPPLETVTVYYNNVPTQVQKGAFLVFPDGRQVPVDPSRKICNVLDVSIKGRHPKRVVLYEDTEEDVRKWKETSELTERLELIFMKNICPEIQDESELKRISEEADRRYTINIEQHRKEESERTLDVLRKSILQPKSRWTYVTNGLMAVGALCVAFKIVDFIVKKKPGQLLYGTFLAVKGIVYR